MSLFINFFFFIFVSVSYVNNVYNYLKKLNYEKIFTKTNKQFHIGFLKKNINYFPLPTIIQKETIRCFVSETRILYLLTLISLHTFLNFI